MSSLKKLRISNNSMSLRFKGVKDKNILKLFGKPLIYYSILFAKSCNFIDRVIISTDSKIRNNCKTWSRGSSFEAKKINVLWI